MNADFIMGAFNRQYSDYPEQPASEPSISPSPVQNEPKKSNRRLYISIGVIILILAAVAVFYFSGGFGTTEQEQPGSDVPGSQEETPSDNDEPGNVPPEELEGNRVCDSGENCFDNPGECKCKADEYCFIETKTCSKARCGNQMCETGEYSDNCCDDCGCATPDCEVCNKATHICEIPEANISDAFVIEKVNEFYSDLGYSVSNITVQGSTCTNSQRSKSAAVDVAGIEFRRLVRVTESGEVLVLDTS